LAFVWIVLIREPRESLREFCVLLTQNVPGMSEIAAKDKEEDRSY
jgi:hypothetical protein